MSIEASLRTRYDYVAVAMLALASSWRADLGFALLETISLDEGDLRLSGEPENLFSFVNPSKDD